MRFILFILAASALLNGCTSTKPLVPIDNISRYQQQLLGIDTWELRGRINVHVPDDSDTVSVNWDNDGDKYTIYLRGTLGIGATRIMGSPGLVRMERGGEEPVVSRSAEELIYTELGREIPISDLYYWIRGLPAPKPTPKQISLTEQGLLESLNQSGWTLRYSEYQAVGNWNMPKKIIAERDDFTLTLYGLRWTLPELQ